MAKKPGKGKGGKHSADWAKAKKLCRLSMEDIRMAKEMVLNPRSLIKNIPSKNEQWKALVKDWIRDMYAKRQKRSAQKTKRKEERKYRPK